MAGLDRVARRVLGWETVIVLGLCLGRSAFYSILSIIDSLTRPQPLNQQTTAMNTSVTPDRPWLDLSYQVANIVFNYLVPVALVCVLVAVHRPPAPRWRDALGFGRRRVGFDAAWAFGLAAIIGVPGLGLYLVARAVGANLNVAPANLAENWWTVPMYVLLALANGLLEETVMIGYLFARWRQVGWRTWQVIVVSAVIRGSYHLYQGFGGFVGNIVMGLVFGYWYTRVKRVWPLIIAHTLIDIAAFVGYSLLKGQVSWL